MTHGSLKALGSVIGDHVFERVVIQKPDALVDPHRIGMRDTLRFSSWSSPPPCPPPACCLPIALPTYPSNVGVRSSSDGDGSPVQIYASQRIHALDDYVDDPFREPRSPSGTRRTWLPACRRACTASSHRPPACPPPRSVICLPARPCSCVVLRLQRPPSVGHPASRSHRSLRLNGITLPHPGNIPCTAMCRSRSARMSQRPAAAQTATPSATASIMRHTGSGA